MDYHSDDDNNHDAKYQAIRYGVSRSDFTKYVLRKKYDFTESDLGKTVTENTREKWKQVRYLIDECIEDGYLREEEKFTTRPSQVIGGKNERVSIGHYLHLTSKGKKLARKSYFYLKYLPEEFSDLKIILITILGTVATSPLWLKLSPFIESFVAKLTN